MCSTIDSYYSYLISFAKFIQSLWNNLSMGESKISVCSCLRSLLAVPPVVVQLFSLKVVYQVLRGLRCPSVFSYRVD